MALKALESGFILQFQDGNIGSSLAITVATPTELVKVRLRAERKLPPGAQRRYSGTLNASSTILRQVVIDGLRDRKIAYQLCLRESFCKSK
ncbi:putative mitochondrial carrier domain-containing protein [Rosa chinensis]|uniref:Putative mitochondrial carrier domain-containing protein n=1 Tax=Rosa chinensis TaxID=74649 RepID=A0A2P6RZ28_ROSCH|nr:putative mitochondrial carrier domain-containing protein [Rosa chinensis]